ncbi:MAG TPA: hypothetical protein VIY66_14535 [Candidatus Acidoferrales bacterium]
MSQQNIALPGTRGEGLSFPSPGPEAPAAEAVVAPARPVASASRALEILKWVFSFPAMLGTFLVGAAFYAGRVFTVDPDMWWHITTGQTILATHHWPTVDPYSFTVHGQPWIAFEWLGEVLIGAVARIGGVRGLDALVIVLGGAVMIALYVFATIRAGNSKAGFLAAAVLFALANPSFSMRPQMLGYLFLVLTLIALELFRQGKRWPIWFLPPLFLLWVNTHGSFIVGLGVMLVYLVCGLKGFRLGAIEAKQWSAKERIRLESVFLLCLAVLPITPYGTRLAVYPFDMALSQPINVAHILEWQPMPFNLPGGKIFLAVVLGFFVVQMIFDLKWRLAELVLFLSGVVMACLHVRFILLFVPFCAPLLAVVFARWLPRYDRKIDKYILNAALMAGAIAAMVFYFPSKTFLDKKVAKEFPVNAVEYLRQHPVAGPMFNDYGFGGYLLWSGRKVFIDGRGDVYERGGVLSDYLHITMLEPGALTVLRNYGIQSCLLDRNAPLATVLAALPDWQRVYADDTAVVFVRRQMPATKVAAGAV